MGSKLAVGRPGALPLATGASSAGGEGAEPLAFLAFCRADRGTRDQAAYKAGTKHSVSTVAVSKPPMMAMAMGPQNTEKAKGTRAKMAAAAVSRMGRARRTVASTMASVMVAPSARSWSIWLTRMTEFRMMMPASAMKPSMATKPKGAPVIRRAAVTPIRPSGAVSTTIATRPKDCICTMSSDSMTSSMRGMMAFTLAWPFALSSTAPAVSIRWPAGRAARMAASLGRTAAVATGAWTPGAVSPRTRIIGVRARRQTTGCSRPQPTWATWASGTARPSPPGRVAGMVMSPRLPMSWRSEGMARAMTGMRSLFSRYWVMVAPCWRVCRVLATSSLERPSKRALSWSRSMVTDLARAPQDSLTLRISGVSSMAAWTCWPMRRMVSASGPMMRNCTG